MITLILATAVAFGAAGFVIGWNEGVSYMEDKIRKTKSDAVAERARVSYNAFKEGIKSAKAAYEKRSQLER